MADNTEYYRENYNDMVKSWKSLAESGNASAAETLGDLLCQGPSGKERNIAAAFPYWKMAADGGETRSQRVVGSIYEEGTDSIAPNPDLAMTYYSRAAYADDRLAQYRLGCMYAYHKEEYILGLHWVCCAHLNGLQDATGYLNKWVKKMADANGDDGSLHYDVIQYIMEEIESKGIDPAKCDYAHFYSSSNSNSSPAQKSEGCYIATAVYGAYDCPQVWVLRRFRDNILAAKWYGRVGIRIYYAISPTLVKWFAHAGWFRVFWRKKLDRLVNLLKKQGVESTPYKDKCTR